MRRTYKKTGLGVLGMAAVLACVNATHAQCDPEWSDRFALPGIRGEIYDVLRFDDGTGEKLYVAGEFRDVGSLSSTGLVGSYRGVVRWNGSSWENVGPGIGGAGAAEGGGRIVYTMAAYDPDGAGPAPAQLYIGGDFYWSNHTLTRTMAVLNNNQWEPVGGGAWPSTVNGHQPSVRSLTVFDPDQAGPLQPELYAAGWFAGMGDVQAYGIAKWNGTEWSQVGGTGQLGTLGGAVYVFDDDGAGPGLPALYYGGQYGYVGTLGAPGFAVSDGLARWDGSAWTDVAGVTGTGAFFRFATFDDGTSRSLWVSGNIKLTGSSNPLNLLRRDGGSWSNMIAAPVPGRYAQAMVQFGGEMYLTLDRAAGLAPVFSTNEAPVMRWSPSSQAVLTPVAAIYRSDYQYIDGPGVVRVMSVQDVDLDGPGGSSIIFGGNFRQVGQGANAAAMHNFAAWTPAAGFKNIAEGPANGALGFGWSGIVSVLRELDPDGAGPLGNELFISSGESFGFFGAGPVPTFQAARFDGTTYQAIDFPDIDNFIPQDFAAFDDGSGTSVYVGGGFSDHVAGEVYRIIGATTVSIGSADSSIQKLLAFDDGNGMALWAFGHFLSINGVQTSGAAKWTLATGWAAADAGFAPGTGVREYAIYDRGSGPELYTPSMARWTGSAWDTTINVPGLKIAVYNGELYIAGQFPSINGIPGTLGIAKWNGSSWSSVGGGLGHVPGLTGYFLNVSDMQVHDDGTGAKLYVIGSFTTAGGQPVQNFAIWDGTDWSTIDPGDTGCSESGFCFQASVLESFGGALYFGGSFTVWDGKAAAGLTTLTRPCVPCAADYNQSGAVSVQDIFDFLGDWFAAATRADFNHSGSVTVQDIFDFLSAWFAGC